MLPPTNIILTQKHDIFPKMGLDFPWLTPIFNMDCHGRNHWYLERTTNCAFISISAILNSSHFFPTPSKSQNCKKMYPWIFVAYNAFFHIRHTKHEMAKQTKLLLPLLYYSLLWLFLIVLEILPTHFKNCPSIAFANYATTRVTFSFQAPFILLMHTPLPSLPTMDGSNQSYILYMFYFLLCY